MSQKCKEFFIGLKSHMCWNYENDIFNNFIIKIINNKIILKTSDRTYYNIKYQIPFDELSNDIYGKRLLKGWDIGMYVKDGHLFLYDEYNMYVQHPEYIIPRKTTGKKDILEYMRNTEFLKQTHLYDIIESINNINDEPGEIRIFRDGDNKMVEAHVIMKSKHAICEKFKYTYDEKYEKNYNGIFTVSSKYYRY